MNTYLMHIVRLSKKVLGAMVKDNKDATINVCVNPETKRAVQKILGKRGLTASKVGRLFFEQFVERYKVPGSSITIDFPIESKDDLKQE